MVVSSSLRSSKIKNAVLVMSLYFYTAAGKVVMIYFVQEIN